MPFVPLSKCFRGESPPNELDGRFDVRVDASFDGTGMRGIFEPLLVFRAGCLGDSNGDNEALDFSRGRAAHLLLNRCRGPGKVDVQSSGKNTHRSQHAGTQGCSDKVSGRETFSPTLIIDRCVGSQFGAGWRVD